MTCGLCNDVKNYFPKGLESPIAELLSRPPQWLGVKRNGTNDLIRSGALIQVSLEDLRTRNICAHVPGSISFGESIDRTLVASHNGGEPESLNVQRQVVDQSENRPA